MYITIATVFRRFEMSLHDVDAGDIRYNVAFFTGWYPICKSARSAHGANFC
jgi:hypothetical protein